MTLLSEGHEIQPQPSTVYSWHSMPSDGTTPSDFPLSAMCAFCGLPIIRRRMHARWEHRPAGEEITEPADS